MLPLNVQTEGGLDYLTLLLPLILCCVLPMFFRQGQGSQGGNESDSWYVTTNVQESYDTIVREVDEWRNQAAEKKTKGISSFFSRKKKDPFSIDQDVPPRLYSVNDEERGDISFELTEVEGGGTSIKSTYDSRARALIQNFKAKLPAKIPSTGPKICPSCGKEVMAEFNACPYCGTKLK